MNDRINISPLYNGAVVVDADSTSWGEPPVDQGLYQFTLIKHELRTIEKRSGGCFRQSFAPSSIVLVRPGELEAVYADGHIIPRVALSGFLFKPHLTKGIFGDDHLDGARFDDPLAAKLLEAAVHLRSESDPLLVDHITMALLHRIRGLRPQLEIKNKGRIERSLTYINDRIDQKLTLDELAGAASMSSYHFVRTFRKVTGTTPLAYVTSKRVERAKQLIATAKHPMASIALMCGFSSQSHFSTAFKEATGATPREYLLATAKAVTNAGMQFLLTCAGVLALGSDLLGDIALLA